MMMIKMRTAALIVMLKTGMKRIAKTIITLTTTLFIIAIRLYSIVINEKQMFVKYFTVYIHNIPLLIFFLPNKELSFSSVGNLYMVTGIYLHDPPPFNGPPFSESQKVVTLPLFPPLLPPLLISDKSLRQSFIITSIIIHSKYFPDSDWLKALI